MLRNHDFICFNMGLMILGTELWVLDHDFTCY